MQLLGDARECEVIAADEAAGAARRAREDASVGTPAPEAQALQLIRCDAKPGGLEEHVVDRGGLEDVPG